VSFIIAISTPPNSSKRKLRNRKLQNYIKEQERLKMVKRERCAGQFLEQKLVWRQLQKSKTE